MLRQSIYVFIAMIAINTTTNAITENDPFSDYIDLEIEKLELEDSLFQNQLPDTEAVSIASIQVYEIEEEITFDFNTADFLPEGFDAKAGMETIDWDQIKLYEFEEELDLEFDTKAYLPAGFNPLKGMACKETSIVSN